MKTNTDQKNPQRAAPCDSAGFTLIEVMISMVLLAIGMLAMAAAQLHSLRFAADSDNRSQAIYLAEEQLARFAAMNDTDPLLAMNGADADAIVLAEDATSANPEGVGETMQYFRSWTIEAMPGYALKRITVRVRWTGGTGSSQVELVGVR